MVRRGLVLALLVLVAPLDLPAQVPVQMKETPLAEGRRALVVRGQRFGILADEHPATVLSRDIFQRIVRAAGRRLGVALELYVLDTSAVVAEALPGGLVVISRGFVDLARWDQSAIAFILGHEVAHLVRDHHGLLDSLGMLGVGHTPGGGAQAQVRAYQSVELEADRLGVLFATLAGYQPSAAIPILMTLTNRVGPDRFHPEPKERASAIRDQLTEVSQRMEVFHLGLFLLTSGRYLEAARVLEHFLTLFPSREVLSTVGVAYHKEALRHTPPAEFKHLLVIDPATRAPATRGPVSTSPAFKQSIARAVHYYTLAAEADPTYALAWSNLAAAHVDLGDRELALGHANRAIREDARLASAYNNRALAYLLGNERDHRRAEEDLLRAVQLDPAPREIAQNLARLYEIQGSLEKAARWRQAERSQARGDEGEAIANVLVGTPINKLRDWTGEPGVRQIKVPLAMPGGDLTLLVFTGRGVVVLARNGLVEAVGALPVGGAPTRQGLRPGDPATRVEALYGRPAGIEGVQAINVWSYPAGSLTVFVVNDRVHATWTGRAAAVRGAAEGEPSQKNPKMTDRERRNPPAVRGAAEGEPSR